jgi:hypothetical protein
MQYTIAKKSQNVSTTIRGDTLHGVLSSYSTPKAKYSTPHGLKSQNKM